jgi:hypothetical protein
VVGDRGAGGSGGFSPGQRWVVTSRWHEGEPSDETVYVERLTAEGRAFHGFIDSQSRLLVQAG